VKRACLFILSTLCLGHPAAQAQFSFVTNYYGSISITGYLGTGGIVSIPSTLAGLPVSAIQSGAFLDCGSLTGIIIPDTVTNIEINAFIGCSNLMTIEVNSNNPAYTSVSGVLFDSDETTLIMFPEGSDSTSYEIPDGIASIALDAFLYCYGLTSVTIPESVINIGQGAFMDSALTAASIPNSVTSIPPLAFASCSGLKNVTIPDSVTSIGDSSFANTGVTSISLPGGVSYIGSSAFANLGLTNITIPGGATFIGDFTFLNCSNLNNVTIPGGVTNIGYCPFGGCVKMTAINVDSNNPVFSSEAGVVMNKSQTELVEYPAGAHGAYAIPSIVTSMAEFAFAYCPGLTAVTIPNGVTIITNSAFGYCSSLAHVSMPDSIIAIGDGAFSYCSNLSSITIPDGVASIGSGVFGYSGLTSVVIPNSVTNLGEFAFENCPNLLNAVIGNGIASIEAFAFSGSGLTNINIPSSVTNIQSYAFFSCPNLKSATIPNSVTYIANDAFANCAELTAVYFLGNAPSADPTAFQADTKATAYYLAGTTGWDEFSADTGLPVVLLNPLIQASDSSFGVSNNQFGFNITGTTNMPIVVEACTNLASPVWIPLQSLNLTNGSFYFSDPQWTNYPGRFYRISSP
jgi:hypothetical protein